MYAYLIGLLAFVLLVQIILGEKKILCERPRKFRLIKRGEFIDKYNYSIMPKRMDFFAGIFIQVDSYYTVIFSVILKYQSIYCTGKTHTITVILS